MQNLAIADRNSQKLDLESLEKEHETLDKEIAACVKARGFDQLQLKRLKRRKLNLKDSINSIRVGGT